MAEGEVTVQRMLAGVRMFRRMLGPVLGEVWGW